MEYIAKVFGCPDKDRPIYIPGNEIRVNADSLDRALDLIDIEARRTEFPLARFPLVHIDQVRTEDNRIVYQTSWDELDPLVSANLE